MRVDTIENMSNGLKFLFSLVFAYVAGAIGSLATFPNIDTWYETLVRPWFSPPNWVFGPVWNILYFLIGLSFFFLWNKGFKRYKTTRNLFIFHMVLNALWSIVFFGMHNILGAFMIIILMIATLVVLMEQIWRIYKPSMYLLIPYLLWITFASVLNFSIFLLN